MYRYRIYCLELQSDIEFPQLLVSNSDSDPDVIISERNIGRDAGVPQDIKYEIGEEVSWLENSTCYLRIENGNRITYSLKEGGNRKYILTYILGWGMAMLAYQRNELAMHCSVVSNDNGAVLICGESGCGKSTITTAFLESGYRFMADDMAFVSTIDGISYVKPAFPYQKLCADAAMASGCPSEDMIYIDEMKDKYLIPYRGEYIDAPVRIRTIIILFRCEEEKVIRKEIKGIDKLHACLNNTFLRRLLKEHMYLPKTGSLGLGIAGSVSMYAIGRPDGRDTREEVIRECQAAVFPS